MDTVIGMKEAFLDATGHVSNYYKSKGNWAPLQGVFDNDNRLWVLKVLIKTM